MKENITISNKRSKDGKDGTDTKDSTDAKGVTSIERGKGSANRNVIY